MMKLIKYLAALPIALMGIGIAQAKGDIFYTVPFSNIEIKPASKIYADYRFDGHAQVLVCKTDPQNDAITSVDWQYKDTTRKVELPVTLKDDVKFQGHFADPEGRLVITNEFGSSLNSGSIFVSCEYKNNN